MTTSYAALQLEITGLTAGWLTCEISVASDIVALQASYLSDAISGLADAVIAVINGVACSVCPWADEPGEYRWVFERVNRSVRVRVIHFAETFSRADNDQGECLFELICDPYQVARQVRDQLLRLRDEYGPGGYQERWKHPFPSAALKELERLTTRAHHHDG